MTTPAAVYDYDLRSEERTLRKRQAVPSGHNPADYVTRRLFARAGPRARGQRRMALVERQAARLGLVDHPAQRHGGVAPLRLAHGTGHHPLREQRLAGAALDVITEEPPAADHPVIVAASTLDNLLVTPHTAWSAQSAAPPTDHECRTS